FGIDAKSVVNAPDAASEIQARTSRFGGAFFAESYIEGREFNISVIEGVSGPVVLPPAEIDFVGFTPDRPRIVDYEAKWIEGSHAFDNTPRRFDFPGSDDGLLESLRKLSELTWNLFGLRGYARVDFRVGADGRPWILEINLNPCLTPDAGFPAAAKRAGFTYDNLIGHLLETALCRKRLAV
ncbi:MAG: hypothetical protein OQJ76_02280, partial [Rhodospirillales bacterium]|nr:hypothetical protein [Rhodospirillales bacterium]